jgi:hypothetical protein
MDLIAGLEAVEKRKISYPYWEWNPGSPLSAEISRLKVVFREHPILGPFKSGDT